MKMNMKKWFDDLRKAKTKKALPILSFPAVTLMDITVKQLISDSTLQAEGMKKVAERIPSAASVGFMDLSVEAESFGSTISVSDHEVPTVKGRIITCSEDAEALKIPEVGSARTGLYINAIKNACETINDRPVFAGMIGPFSLAARLYDVSEIMMECYDDPDTVHVVLQKTTDFLISYAKAFRQNGANGVMIAEPVAGLLSTALEDEFSAPYIKQIVDAVQDEEFSVIYHNCGDNVHNMLDSILSTGCAAYHFGNSSDMNEIMGKMPCDTVVMGNVDPVGILRMGDTAKVRSATLELMEKCCKYPNFVISSGCDMPPLTPWENIEAFFGAVDEFYENK